MPVTDLTLLCEAAEEAGKIALHYWQKDPKAWDKEDGAGPVSEADLAVNTMLEQNLRAARPDYGWLSEESVDDPARVDAEQAFIIDPIDGTRAFLHGDGGFAHALAVAQAGRIVAGVVHLPALGLTYSATIDGPALLNGAPITSGNRAEIEGAEVLTSKLSDNPSQWKRGVPGYKRHFRSSLAWRMCLVAEGKFDATISLRPAWEWDTAAASLIAERAGVVSTDRQGKALRFNAPIPQSNGLVVANPALHASFLNELSVWPG
ncbi:MAG: 3'(2'),5'-bisphosphate nucleotidase CysQ [Rhodobacteraceae bacterium]|nr:3'(2'),5'-bisphosphate nucleotidase CysQ [Paracoccaceae bacterium]